jgi:HAMP domain-containing protein
VGTVAERHFQQGQVLLTWSIGVVAVAAAALIALALAHTFLTPIQGIAHAARQLAAGNLGARVQATSRDEIGQLAVDFNLLAQALEKTESTLSRESLRSLLAEVHALSKLVGDVHDLAIADLGALSYRRANVNVGEILRSCVTAFQTRFDQRGLRTRLDLTAVEFRLLQILAKAPGRVFSRDQLLNALYRDHRVVADRTVDSHVKNLRRKLHQAHAGHELVRSVYGVGYKIEA